MFINFLRNLSGSHLDSAAANQEMTMFSRVDDWRASHDVTSPGCVLLTVGCIGPLLASLRESLCLQGVYHMFYMPACQLSAFTVVLTSVLSSVR